MVFELFPAALSPLYDTVATLNTTYEYESVIGHSIIQG
jgi:hypothetical protein